MLSVVRLHDLILALVKYLNRGITTIQWLQILGATNTVVLNLRYFLLIREVSIPLQLTLLERTFPL